MLDGCKCIFSGFQASGQASFLTSGGGMEAGGTSAKLPRCSQPSRYLADRMYRTCKR